MKKISKNQLTLWDSFGADTLPKPGDPSPPSRTRVVQKEDPWQAWLARPHTLENRVEDLVMQIRRDTESLAVTGDPFYAERISMLRTDAAHLLESLA